MWVYAGRLIYFICGLYKSFVSNTDDSESIETMTNGYVIEKRIEGGDDII
jgi:hypothetical protein